MADNLLTKLDVFERSYTEVLTALKHQDDKLNRTLTALAFLTAAGVTLFLTLERSAPLQGTMRFAEGGPPVTSVMFVVFLSAVAVALLTTLTAIGPGAPLRFKGDRATSDPEKPPSGDADTTSTYELGQYTGSLLFYARIASDEDAWTKRFAAPRETSDHEHVQSLQEQLARNYHDETLLIAKRVSYKVARSRESGAFVQLAILALTLLGISEARGLGDPGRWWVSSGLITLVLLLPFWDLRMIRRYDPSEVGRFPNAYKWLAAAVALAIALLVAAEVTAAFHWWAVAYALFVLLTSRMAIISRSDGGVLLRVTPMVGAVLLVVVAIVT